MKKLTIILASMSAISIHAAPCSERAAKDAVKFATTYLGDSGCKDKQISMLKSDAFTTSFRVDLVCDSDEALPGSFKSYKVVEAIKFRERKIICEEVSVRPMRAPRGTTYKN